MSTAKQIKQTKYIEIQGQTEIGLGLHPEIYSQILAELLFIVIF